MENPVNFRRLKTSITRRFEEMTEGVIAFIYTLNIDFLRREGDSNPRQV